MLPNSSNNQELRKAVSRITKRYGPLPEREHLTDRERLSKVHLQVPEIERLRRSYRHSISLVRQVVPDDVETWKYCCYEYTFDLIDPHRQDIRDWIGKRVSVDSTFARYLVQNHLLEQDSSKPGCVIVYYSGVEQIEHVGKVIEEGLVESKWGCQGHLWKHGRYEVPESYGGNVRYFSSIAAEESSRAFAAYVSLQQKRPGIPITQHRSRR